MTLLSKADVGRGSEARYRDQMPGVLDALAAHARTASALTSSAIEGVVVPSPTRAEGIISGRVRVLRNRDEQELAGYRDVMDYVFQEERSPLAGGLLHLHRLLFAHTRSPGGRYKERNNLVVEGTTAVRFVPVAAAHTDLHVRRLIDGYAWAQEAEGHHPILLSGLFVLDLLVIHPFEDGNGRVARALTNALLADAGYGVVRYVSLEELVAESLDGYYRSLLDSTHGWHEGAADPWPWLAYFVEILAAAYARFAQRAAAERSNGTKQDRVRDYVLHHARPVFRVADVRRAIPGASDPTIRMVLARLRDEGFIAADGTGRSAAWHRHR